MVQFVYPQNLKRAFPLITTKEDEMRCELHVTIKNLFIYT